MLQSREADFFFSTIHTHSVGILLSIAFVWKEKKMMDSISKPHRPGSLDHKGSERECYGRTKGPLHPSPSFCPQAYAHNPTKQRPHRNHNNNHQQFTFYAKQVKVRKPSLVEEVYRRLIRLHPRAVVSNGKRK